MPTYRWTLKNKKYCTGCPMHSEERSIIAHASAPIAHYCRASYYIGGVLGVYDKPKKRPIACVCELGE